MSSPLLPVQEYMYRDPLSTRMEDPATFWTSNWTINVSDVKTVQISNLSPYASERNIRDFFAVAEELVSTMIAKGYMMGKDALHKAKEFDEDILHLSSNVTAIDERVGLIEKLNQGMVAVRKMERQFQVKETTRSAILLAQTAGSALLDSDNEYVATGASWFAGAFAAMAKAATNVKVMTREKLERAVEEKRAVLLQERTGTGSIFVNKLAHMHFDHQLRRHHHTYISQSDPRKLTFY